MRIKIIFVGIESKHRSNDITPLKAKVGKETNKGKADDYLHWLTKVLISFLRSRYRISCISKDIGVADASYDALVSLYALYLLPQYFGTYVLISPSVWYPGFIEFTKKKSINLKVRVYWYIGLKEGIKYTLIIKNMVPSTFNGVNILENQLNNKESAFNFLTSKQDIHRHRYFKKYFKKIL